MLSEYTEAGSRSNSPSSPRASGQTPSALRVTGLERRQVFDLPDIALRVSEHQLIKTQLHGQVPDAPIPGCPGPSEYQVAPSPAFRVIRGF
jgi:hypothetical protein